MSEHDINAEVRATINNYLAHRSKATETENELITEIMVALGKRPKYKTPVIITINCTVCGATQEILLSEWTHCKFYCNECDYITKHIFYMEEDQPERCAFGCCYKPQAHSEMEVIDMSGEFNLDTDDIDALTWTGVPQDRVGLCERTETKIGEHLTKEQLENLSSLNRVMRELINHKNILESHNYVFWFDVETSEVYRQHITWGGLYAEESNNAPYPEEDRFED